MANGKHCQRWCCMEKVALTHCDDYTKNALKRSVDILFQLVPPPVTSGDTVFLKANLLMAKRPDLAITTHPLLIGEIARRFLSRGCRVIVGDSPGGPFHVAALQHIYRVCGLTEAAKEFGFELNLDVASKEINYAAGQRGKQFTMVKAMVEADHLISIGKLKTHGMMLYTGAAKNMFGTIPGANKVQYHLNMPDYDDFARLLVDICRAAGPDYAIIDAVWGMEGNGPSGGTPKYVGALLAGENPFAVDCIGAALMGLAPESVPMLRVALENHFCSNSPEILGDALTSFPQEPFRLPESKPIHFYRGKLPQPIADFLDNYTRPWPIFNGLDCNGCGICARSCPPQAILLQAGRPQVDLAKCIRCFCCHELCPNGAIEIKKRWLSHLLSRL